MLSRFTNDIIDSAHGDDERATRVHELRDAHATLNYWQDSFQDMNEPQMSKFKHSSRKLIQAIKSASLLRGGGKRLSEMVARVLTMALPPAFHEAFMHYASHEGDELLQARLSKDMDEAIPSPSLINRYELCLDLAISMLQRLIKERSPAGSLIKFGLTDASPMAGYDWLWSMFIEIRRERLISTWQSVMFIKRSTEQYISTIKSSLPEGVEPTLEQLTHVPESWKPHLHALKHNIVLHVNVPTGLAAGHASLADKAQSEVYKMHISSPPQRPI
jgi:hypothetical protein